MVQETIILTRHELADFVEMREVVGAMELCFAAFEDGRDVLPPKYIVQVPGGIAACMTGYTAADHKLTMKLGQERKGNTARGLPTIFQTVNLYDPDTGELLMIAESVLATMMRTAAAAAVGARHLARKDARIAAVVGAGQLGRQCVRALASEARYEKIYLSDLRPEQAQAVAADLAASEGLPVEAAGAESACRAADVICSATNSTEPVIKDAWIREGTHLSCMGADMAHKIECEIPLLTRCRLFADNPAECAQKGEVSHAIDQGILPPNPYAGSLGQVILGKLEGRQNDAQITLFDGIGTGVQDTTVATSIYEQALAAGRGTSIHFL